MKRRPPRSTRTDTLFPYTTLFRNVKMTTERPKTPGWFWWEIPGNRALHPVLVYEAERGLRYTDDEYDFDRRPERRNGFFVAAAAPERSEERRVGQEGVSTGRYRWAPYN